MNNELVLNEKTLDSRLGYVIKNIFTSFSYLVIERCKNTTNKEMFNNGKRINKNKWY